MTDRPYSNTRPHQTVISLLAILTVTLAWLMCTIAQVEKYLGVARGSVLTALGAVGVVLLMLFLRGLYRRGQDLPRWTVWAVLGVMFLSFAVLYPKSLHPLPGKGSDREDALRVELQAVAHHRFPYDARTFLHHAPTPLPGAMLLASAFYATSRVALQNLVWAVLFCLFLVRFFARQGTAAAFTLLFLLTALENLNDFDVGGDFVINILYVILAIAVFAQATRPSTNVWRTAGAVCLLGVVLSSRAVYAITLVPLLAFGIRNGSAKRTILMFLGALLVAASITLPVFMPHPVSGLATQLAQNASKFQFLPPFLPAKLLMLVALLVASLGFFSRRLSLQQVYGLGGAAMLLLIFPPMAFIVKHEGGWTAPLTTDLEYLAPAALFIGLWALSLWERDSLMELRPVV